MERWDGKSGHGAESVRHAEMSLAGNWESIGPVNHRLACEALRVGGPVPGSCGETMAVNL